MSESEDMILIGMLLVLTIVAAVALVPVVRAGGRNGPTGPPRSRLDDQPFRRREFP